QRQDALVDIFLKSVTTVKHAAQKQLNEQEQQTKADRNSAIQALSQSHKTAQQLIKEVSLIVNAAGVTPNEKYYKIESLIFDYEQNPDGRTNQILIEELDQQIDRITKNKAYYEVLSNLSNRL